MKTERSSTLTIYSGLSVFWGGTLGLSALYVVFLILILFKITPMPLDYGLNVRLEPIVKINEINNGYSLVNLEGKLICFDPGLGISVLLGLIPVLVWTSVSYAVFLLRKILKNVYNGNHFNSENIKYTKILAYLIIIVPHIIVIMQNIALSTLPQKLSIHSMEVKKLVSGPIQIFNFVVLPHYILLGAVIYVFAEVFKVGNVLKQENDLTV
jgi:hypothetical protein